VGGGELGLSYAQTSTLSVLLTGAVCFVALLMVARPLNRLKIGLVVAMAVCFAVAVLFMSRLFSLVSLFDWQLALYYLPLLVTVYPFFYLVQELLGKRVFAKIKWR
jgi:cation-transporting ATPase E